MVIVSKLRLVGLGIACFAMEIVEANCFKQPRFEYGLEVARAVSDHVMEVQIPICNAGVAQKAA